MWWRFFSQQTSTPHHGNRMHRCLQPFGLVEVARRSPRRSSSTMFRIASSSLLDLAPPAPPVMHTISMMRGTRNRLEDGRPARPPLRCVVVACVLVASLLGCHDAADPPAASTSFAIAEGQRLFASWCAPCHGEEGRGDGAYLSAGAPSLPPNFTAAEVRGRLRTGAVTARLRATEPLGESHCPPWGETLSADETASLARYLEELTAGPRQR